MATSLDEAKEWLRGRVEDGERCPCCTQMAKVYRRKINSGMARALIAQYRKCGQRSVHTRDIWLPYSKEAAQLKWCGLVDQEPDVLREDGGQSGYWRITDLGVAFIRNETLVHKYVRVYDGRVLSVDGTSLVSITDALGSKFNYKELMHGL